MTSKKILKKWDKEARDMAVIIAGGTIWMYKWFPRKCKKAYEEWKKEGEKNEK